MINTPAGKTDHILLVEDNAADARLMLEVFAELQDGDRFSVARDGVEAIELLRVACDSPGTSLPDLILLDLNLPRKSGREVLQELKADVRLMHIPVVVLTSSDDESDVTHAYRLGAAGYLTKPAQLDEFSRVVRALSYYWFTLVRLPARDCGAHPSGSPR